MPRSSRVPLGYGHFFRPPGEVDVPVLVVWGEEDAWLDPSQADRLGEAIPDSRVTKMPGVGHFVPEDAPEELARELSAFLAEGGARP